MVKLAFYKCPNTPATTPIDVELTLRFTSNTVWFKNITLAPLELKPYVTEDCNETKTVSFTKQFSIYIEAPLKTAINKEEL